MGFVPKGVQRKNNALAMMRATSQTTLALMGMQVSARVHKEFAGEVPRRLELGLTPTHVCNAFDVYLDGKRQQLCTVADVDKGYIKRYVHGVGRKPVPNKEGAFDVELLWGKVQIVPKGTKLPQDDTKAAP